MSQTKTPPATVSSIARVTVQVFFCEPLKPKTFSDPQYQRCEAHCARDGEQGFVVVDWIEPIEKAWMGSLLSQAQKQGFPVVLTYHENAQGFKVLDTVRR